MSLMNSAAPRVYRPLGLTLAIVASVVLFGLWPLVKTYVAYRLNRQVEGDLVMWGNDAFAFDSLTQIIGAMGVLLLVTAVMAWVGKPPQIRFVFQGVVVAITLLLIYETLYRTTGLFREEGGVGDNASQAFAGLAQGQIPIQLLTTLYIIWYCNRAPARAFYRQQPLAVWQPKEENIHESSREPG